MPANGIALIICAACAGYIFISTTHYFKYQTERMSGQHLYLLSVTFGFLFVFLTICVGYSIPKIAVYFDIPWLIDHTAKVWTESASSFVHFIFGLSIITAISRWMLNFVLSSEGSLYKAWQINDLDGTIMESIALSQPIQVTLENRKAYVGYVNGSMDPSPQNSYLKLLPVYSGYRDSDKLQLILENSYFDKYGDFAQMEMREIDNLCIVLPKDKIVSCHIFNVDIYEQVVQDEEDPIKLPQK